ncbi:F0F1 ATP synthase subunit gamma [Pectobacterium phage POP12]|nr:F0F1 ATP synthase subunit gamma [Pectobacterium phage POP12]
MKQLYKIVKEAQNSRPLKIDDVIQYGASHFKVNQIAYSRSGLLCIIAASNDVSSLDVVLKVKCGTVHQEAYMSSIGLVEELSDQNLKFDKKLLQLFNHRKGQLELTVQKKEYVDVPKPIEVGDTIEVIKSPNRKEDYEVLFVAPNGYLTVKTSKKTIVINPADESIIKTLKNVKVVDVNA